MSELERGCNRHPYFSTNDRTLEFKIGQLKEGQYSVHSTLMLMQRLPFNLLVLYFSKRRCWRVELIHRLRRPKLLKLHFCFVRSHRARHHVDQAIKIQVRKVEL